MRVFLQHAKYYEWAPVPADVKVTQADIDAGRVKPSASGGHLMKVTLPAPYDGHSTMFSITEGQVISKIIHAYCENSKCAVVSTRAEAVARHIRENLAHHTHSKWVTRVEVEDDGPNEAEFRAALAPHLEADHGSAPGKNIEADDVDALVKAYMTPIGAAGHVDHLTKHFRIGGAK